MALKKAMKKALSTEGMAVDPVSAEGVQEWEMLETTELEENEESSNDTSYYSMCDCVGESGCGSLNR